MEFHGRVSFLKAGIATADVLTTVSPNYAEEIIGEAHGCGLHGLLAQRRERLNGIMNGADYGIWDPRIDLHLPRPYGPEKMAGKRTTKLAMQEMLDLPVDAEVPVLAFLSRLDYQKMPDVVADALPALLEDGVQFLMVAEGQGDYEECFRALAARYPSQIRISHYSETQAHRVLAAADILLHPARYEPCGLVPIYAMRYGTIPVVRRIGGMVDSVTEVTAETLQDNRATGFFFEEPTAEALLAGTRRALGYFDQPIIWRKIQRAAVAQDFSWKRSAQAYLELYRSLRETPDITVEPVETASEVLTA
jgi:starch synthase